MATRPTKRVPAPPFTTSTLQQEAARKLGFPVALTMRVAQALYESGRITYMRTDSMNLSNLCLSSCAPVIEQLMGSGYHKRRTYHTHSKGAQEAHEAIRPTDMACTSITGTAQEKRLYDLIWRRTIACQMEDALLEKTTVTIAPEGRSERFTATGEVVRFEGFLKVYRESVNDDDAHAAGYRQICFTPLIAVLSDDADFLLPQSQIQKCGSQRIHIVQHLAECDFPERLVSVELLLEQGPLRKMCHRGLQHIL